MDAQIPVARELWTGERARLRGLKTEDAEFFDRMNLEPDDSFADDFAYPALGADHNQKFVERELSRHRNQGKARICAS